jgi:hypothetical protein
MLLFSRMTFSSGILYLFALDSSFDMVLLFRMVVSIVCFECVFSIFKCYSRGVIESLKSLPTQWMRNYGFPYISST